MFTRSGDKWRRRIGRRSLDGERVFEIHPSPKPVLKTPISWGVLERACLALDLDPDDMLAGRIETIGEVKLSNAEAFLNAVLENAAAYDFKAWKPAYLLDYAAGVAGVFFYRCAKLSPMRKAIYNAYARSRIQPGKS